MMATDNNTLSTIITLLSAIVLSSISFAILFIAPVWSISYIEESPCLLPLFFLPDDMTDKYWPMPDRKIFFDYEAYRNYLKSNNTNHTNSITAVTPAPLSSDVKFRNFPVYKEPEQPAHVIYRVEPIFPEIKKKKAVEGSLIIVEVMITETGHVESAFIIRGVHPLWNKAVLDAVKQWRFEPARNNKPVSSTLILAFHLNLH